MAHTYGDLKAIIDRIERSGQFPGLIGPKLRAEIDSWTTKLSEDLPPEFDVIFEILVSGQVKMVTQYLGPPILLDKIC
jgi:hypothetical protein